MNFIRYILLMCVCITSIIITSAQSSNQIESQLDRIQRSTVFIYQVNDVDDNFIITCVGSGTLISRQGLILTNAHNTVTNANCPGNTLIIALSIRLDIPPVPLYRAEITQADVGLDLVLLRINQDVDGRRLNIDDLALPFVELGNSSQLQLDETITIVGYPNLDDEPIQTIRGTVSNFTAEPRGGEKSWIKTSASIPGLMSGGGAYNQAGQLVAIPTTTPPSLNASVGTCRILQDTNQDGLVNNNDVCVPIGGFINTMRPSQFTRPLLRAASLNLEIITETSSLQTTPTNENPPEISRLFFSTSINEANLPQTIVSSVPTGTTSLYLFFDYANMTPETVYELRVTTDNIPNPNFSLAPVRWSGEANGIWYIGSSGQTWSNGVYNFTIFIDGIAKATAGILVGGTPTESPSLSDIVFGLSDIDGTPLGNGFVLPVGNIASARFIYRNMPGETEWIARWFYEGNEIFRTPPDLWRDGPSGAKTISIQDPNGQLLPGRYRLELYVEQRLAATSDFTIAGNPQGAFPQVFTNTHFASADNPIAAIEAPANSNFTTNISNMYAIFDWSQITRGTSWTIRWSVDSEVFFEQRTRWQEDSNGQNFTILVNRSDGLPDGTYKLDLLIDQVLLESVEAVIGIGQLTIDRFSQTSGLQLRGQILDVDTQDGIQGVTFIVISEDFSVADFEWNSNQIYTQATTDRNGNFQLERLLEISTDNQTIPYSVIISANGYLPIEADGFVVDEETVNPLDLIIYLMRE